MQRKARDDDQHQDGADQQDDRRVAHIVRTGGHRLRVAIVSLRHLAIHNSASAGLLDAGTAVDQPDATVERALFIAKQRTAVKTIFLGKRWRLSLS